MLFVEKKEVETVGVRYGNKIVSEIQPRTSTRSKYKSYLAWTWTLAHDDTDDHVTKQNKMIDGPEAANCALAGARSIRFVAAKHPVTDVLIRAAR